MCVVVVFFFQGLGDHRDLHVLTHSFPTRRSSDLLGLANWPAMRPSFTTGSLEAKVSTTAICSRTRKVSRMLLGWNSAKLSAQSPPCSRNAFPAATCASWLFSSRASPEIGRAHV